MISKLTILELSLSLELGLLDDWEADLALFGQVLSVD